jgi:hypothetical protein
MDFAHAIGYGNALIARFIINGPTPVLYRTGTPGFRWKYIFWAYDADETQSVWRAFGVYPIFEGSTLKAQTVWGIMNRTVVPS